MHVQEERKEELENLIAQYQHLTAIEEEKLLNVKKEAEKQQINQNIGRYSSVLNRYAQELSILERELTLLYKGDDLGYPTTIFKDDLEQQGVGTSADIQRNDYNAFLPVPLGTDKD